MRKKKKAKYSHRIAKEWDFFSIWDEKGPQTGYCLHLMCEEAAEKKMVQVTMRHEIKEVQAE